MGHKDKLKVLFSIISTLFSSFLIYLERFKQSLRVVDSRIIFISGILLLMVISILLFIFAKDFIQIRGVRKWINKKLK